MGILIGLAMIGKTRADFAVLNSGGVRESLPAGTLTYTASGLRKVFTWLLMAEVAALAAGSIEPSRQVVLRRAIRNHMDGLVDLADLRLHLVEQFAVGSHCFWKYSGRNAGRGGGGSMKEMRRRS